MLEEKRGEGGNSLNLAQGMVLHFGLVRSCDSESAQVLPHLLLGDVLVQLAEVVKWREGQVQGVDEVLSVSGDAEMRMRLDVAGGWDQLSCDQLQQSCLSGTVRSTSGGKQRNRRGRSPRR